MIGLLTTGSSGFGWFAVIGRSLVPSPPAMTTALTVASAPLRLAPLTMVRCPGAVYCGTPACPVSSEQAAGLLEIERSGPPVQCSSPQSEGPTEDLGNTRIRTRM